MATPFWAKAVGCIQESRLVDTLQYHANHFLYQFIVEGGYTKGTLFAIGLGDICPAGRGGLVSEISQLSNQRIDTLHTHTVHSLAICSGGHTALLGLYFLIRSQVKFGVIQITVETLILVIAVACFGTKTFQYILGTSHGVSHTVSFSILIDDRQTGPLRHVDGFPALGLLWGLRYHAGFSALSFSGC